MGGLIDFAILGSGDRHMATSMIGRVDLSLPPSLERHQRYCRKLRIWQERALRHIRYDIGFVPGTILHSWHGKKAGRNYVGRWDVLARNRFDPDVHLKRDWQGLWQLTDFSPQLRNDIRRYFRQRREDSIDL